MSEPTLAAIFAGIASVLTAIGMMVASIVTGRSTIRKSELESLRGELKETKSKLNEAESREEVLRNDYYDAQDILSVYRKAMLEANVPFPPFKRHRDGRKKGRVEETQAADE